MRTRYLYVGLILSMVLFLLGCANQPTLTISEENWGALDDGRPVSLFTLTNQEGVTAQITNYGGTLVSVKWADKNGEVEDVLLGHRTLEGYLEDNPYFGGIIGRYANRIDEGQFALDGESYQLATNDGPNHLHGGDKGFDKVVWDAQTFQEADSVGVRLRYVSADGEENYPGEVTVEVTYSLNSNDELRLDYAATTDEKTIINLTSHPYWNLAGQGAEPVLDHIMMINADHFTPIDETLIPTGKIRSVEGTPFDFTEPTKIGKRIDADNQQIEYGNGYDHNWVLNQDEPGEMVLACRISEEESGRILEVMTTEPGLQFYSGNFLDGSITGKDGEMYEYREAVVVEAQHFPDSPNHPNFPSTVLNPGEEYSQTTIYKFITE
ncbi:MAG: galactose mutarotase [Candidatus Marinimicrobia bacterium]|nr:galactose mutarotase [Candidatus Neomarinimicrobiota bacterium]MCF7880236.1 galactose mutarotase [Candidatus Neomarinimicrobiota bacterium]